MAKTLICTQCGYIGNPKTAIEGNGCLEIVLWLLFIVPGLIYSIWRSTSRHKVCPKCKSPNLIPIDSPRGQQIMKETMSNKEVEKVSETNKNINN
jgi:hypothetical protein